MEHLIVYRSPSADRGPLASGRGFRPAGRRRLRVLRAALAVAACGALLGAACGSSSAPAAPSDTTGSSGGGSTGGGGTPATTTTFTITASGVTPKNISVPAGTQVTFVNNDSSPHDMSSDPHPVHTDCPEINQVGFLSPGQSKQTGPMRSRPSCGFHDHNQPSNTSLQGTIVSQ